MAPVAIDILGGLRYSGYIWIYLDTFAMFGCIWIYLRWLDTIGHFWRYVGTCGCISICGCICWKRQLETYLVIDGCTFGKVQLDTDIYI